MTGIFDKHQLREFPGKLVDIHRMSGQMHRKDRLDRALGHPGNRALHVFQAHHAGFRIDVSEEHIRFHVSGRVRRGEKGHTRNHDDIAEIQVERQCRHVQTGGAAGAGNRMFRPDALGERRFIGVHRRAGCQPVAAQHLENGLFVSLVNLLSAIGKKGSVMRHIIHLISFPSIRARNCVPAGQADTRAKSGHLSKLSRSPASPALARALAALPGFRG